MHQKHYSEQLGTNFTKAKNYENNFPFSLSTFVLCTLPRLREQAAHPRSPSNTAESRAALSNQNTTGATYKV